METVNSDVKKMDGPQETIQCGTSEVPQCVQVGPEELVKKHIYICFCGYYPHKESLNRDFTFLFIYLFGRCSM